MNKTLMKRKSLLSHVEEIELCKLAQSNDKGSSRAMDKMVTHNLGLVNKIARKLYFKNEQYSYDDLVQEGVIGLMKAINKFDPKEGCRFSTYSYYWIYSFISRYYVNHHGKIRVPAHVKEKLKKLEKSEDTLGFSKLKGSIPSVVSLNSIIGDKTTLEDIVGPEEVDDFGEDIEMVQSHMKNVLTDKEYDVLGHRYGLDGKDAKTQRETAKIYSVTYGAIYLIEKKAIAKLKDHFVGVA